MDEWLALSEAVADAVCVLEVDDVPDGASNLPPVGDMLPLLASVSRTYQHHVFAVHLSAR